MRKKIFSGCGFLNGIAEQVDIIIVTCSRAKASELTGISLSTINNYFSESKNKEHHVVLNEKIDKVFYSKKNRNIWQEYIK